MHDAKQIRATTLGVPGALPWREGIVSEANALRVAGLSRCSTLTRIDEFCGAALNQALTPTVEMKVHANLAPATLVVASATRYEGPLAAGGIFGRQPSNARLPAAIQDYIGEARPYVFCRDSQDAGSSAR